MDGQRQRSPQQWWENEDYPKKRVWGKVIVYFWSLNSGKTSASWVMSGSSRLIRIPLLQLKSYCCLSLSKGCHHSLLPHSLLHWIYIHTSFLLHTFKSKFDPTNLCQHRGIRWSGSEVHQRDVLMLGYYDTPWVGPIHTSPEVDRVTFVRRVQWRL